MEMIKRVQFYSAMDLSIEWQFKRIDELILIKDGWSSFTDINDVIELYETQQVLEACVSKDEKYETAGGNESAGCGHRPSCQPIFWNRNPCLYPGI